MWIIGIAGLLIAAASVYVVDWDESFEPPSREVPIDQPRGVKQVGP
jgi:hypothetical protein